ncbi:MAG TPA: P-II family nitrogen regulator [Syntrophothermus lipocalidus]|uniref:Nitrogen regulatory protein P-II n=1 Tax=Syntrophothermus lipocalidus (strain DSM 12680 / TGB-C1) TaxID=643648 RepID=D7CIZ3_SYNLT|nr:P-II family nitrogen regulator [Syntrophothermus lipocalidus]ADI02871.1 nitrogen regulatory protein P-II [Syntrophothermus lipocalidus DSM 12680]HHV77352.1 P-II family nitrogen regulator [Syntrophothermus lipocalidus]
MKEIMAIIRPKQMTRTKEVLAALGFPALTAWRVLGRGKQKGLAGEVSFEVHPELMKQGGGMKFVPKRFISLVVEDEDVPLVVAAIIKVNRTGEIGDGRIFVCPVDDAARIRTQERSSEAIS